MGRQLTWVLSAEGDTHWSQRLLRAHFDHAFVTHLDSGTGAGVGYPPVPGGASLIGLLSEEPARDPDSLLAVAAFGHMTLTVYVAVDCAGLIDTLQYEPYQPPPASWAQADRELAALAPDASLLAARVSPGGNCTPVHQVAASAARPLGTTSKLFVLGALAHQIAAGRVSWNQELTVTDALKSAGDIGPGYLQDDPAGTRVSVRQTAAQMISIGDSTAADMLAHLVGRSAVQAQDRQWSDHAALNVPFLTTRELFLLIVAHPALANQYLRLAPGQRATFLASSVDPLPLSLSQAQVLRLLQASAAPRDIDTIGWFASPDDICRALAGLQRLATQPRLAPLGSVLSASNGYVYLAPGLDPAQWPAAWFTGGGEQGVLTAGYLATNSKGQTFVVVAMLSDPAAPFSPSTDAGLQAIVRAAFELVL